MDDIKSKKPMGRPVGYRAVNPKNIMLPVKISKTQLNVYKAAAKRTEKTFSAWVRDVLDKASK